MLFSLNVYTFFHVFKTFEMEKKRFENKIRKLRHCLHFTKSKTFSFWIRQSLAKIENFRNKKYIKLISGGGPNKSGEGRGGGESDFFSKKIKQGRRLFGSQEYLLIYLFIWLLFTFIYLVIYGFNFLIFFSEQNKFAMKLFFSCF